VLAVVSSAGGVVLTGILAGWFGVLGDFWAEAAVIALALAAIAAPITGVVALIGRAGLAVGPIVMMLFANPIRGAAMPREFARGRGVDRRWFPPGAAANLLRDVSYFRRRILVLVARPRRVDRGRTVPVGARSLPHGGRRRVGRPRRPRGRRRTGRRRRLTFRPLGIASRRRDAEKPCTARETTAEAVSRARPGLSPARVAARIGRGGAQPRCAR
jgi:hypothetical protein